MVKISKTKLLKEFLGIVLIALLGVLTIVFSVCYVETFNSGFFYQYKKIIVSVIISVIIIISLLAIVFYRCNKEMLYKIFLITIVLTFICSLSLYLLDLFGVLDKIDSVEDLRKYIQSFGNLAVFIYILIQFLQVVLIPIPSFITVGAGVLLYGPFKAAIYSCIGIISGSILAFYIGRFLGFKVAKWLVGEANLNKGLKLIEGRDRVVLTFMFLFPFFPDDILCFVAGITTISPLFFVIMIFVTRFIGIFTSCFSLNNNIIPYNTWWGILIWVLLIGLIIFATYFIYKNGKKIEKIFYSKKRKNIDNNK